MSITFVLGGARSGKSAYAQAQCEVAAAARGSPPLIIATAQAFDDEMRTRIHRHREERGDGWRTLETPTDVAGAVRGLGAGDAVVVDCLTLWLSNLVLADADIAAASDDLLAALAASPANIWLVSNEVGLGIVPDNALARRFRDEAGRLHQRIAAQAQRVVLLVAGLPLVVKG